MHKEIGMRDSTFFVSEAAIRNLKQRAEHRLRGVSSSHLSEGVAAALGFKTHAALRAAIAGRPTIEVSKPSNIRLAQRLNQLGYGSFPSDLRPLPELDHSYTLFKKYPLQRPQGVRWKAWRNLLVMAINAGLEQKMFGLAPGENWWQGGDPESHKCVRGTYRFIVDGESALASVDAISGDELSISVLINPRWADVEPSSYCDLEDGNAAAHCWVERRYGAWIQDGGDEFHCKRALQARLVGLKVEPMGYSDFGSFFM